MYMWCALIINNIHTMFNTSLVRAIKTPSPHIKSNTFPQDLTCWVMMSMNFLSYFFRVYITVGFRYGWIKKDWLKLRAQHQFSGASREKRLKYSKRHNVTWMMFGYMHYILWNMLDYFELKRNNFYGYHLCCTLDIVNVGRNSKLFCVFSAECYVLVLQNTFE